MQCNSALADKTFVQPLSVSLSLSHVHYPKVRFDLLIFGGAYIMETVRINNCK